MTRQTRYALAVLCCLLAMHSSAFAGPTLPLTVTTETPVHAPASTLLTLTAGIKGGSDRPITCQWTQIGGPAVALQYATTPTVSFVRPIQDAVLTFQVAATQQRTTVTAQVQVTVESMATALNLAATTSDGNESSLLVSSTSLRPGFIWPGAAADLAITLASTDGAVLDVASIEEPAKVHLDSGDNVYDVTNLFVYEQPQQTWRLLTAKAADFRALLIDDLMTLNVSGMDTQGRYVSLAVPLFFGRFEIHGTIQAPLGTPTTDVQQPVISLEGATGKYRSTAQAAADGSFVIDGVIADQYTVIASGLNGLFGSAFLRLEASASDTQSADIFLVGPSSAALQQASADGPAMGQTSDRVDCIRGDFRLASGSRVQFG